MDEVKMQIMLIMQTVFPNPYLISETGLKKAYLSSTNVCNDRHTDGTEHERSVVVHHTEY